MNALKTPLPLTEEDEIAEDMEHLLALEPVEAGPLGPLAGELKALGRLYGVDFDGLSD
jgi:hypothetical protein